jgi:DNA-binding protein H-NS
MAKTKKYRSLRVTHRPQRTQTAIRELVLTLSVPDGHVVKVETLEKSGQRHELSEEQFWELAGDEGHEISLEEAYAASITDPTEEEFGLDEEEDGEEEEIERSILWEIVAHQLLRRGVRRIILSRLRMRELIRQRARPVGKPPHEAAHRDSEGHAGSTERTHDISIDELRAMSGLGSGKRISGGRRKIRKIKPMYRDSKTGETWSGFGRTARWLTAHEKAGRKRSEFLIRKA